MPDSTAALHTTIADLRRDLSRLRQAIQKAVFILPSDGPGVAEAMAILNNVLRGDVTIQDVFAIQKGEPVKELEVVEGDNHRQRVRLLEARFKKEVAAHFPHRQVLPIETFDWLLNSFHLVPRFGVEPLGPPIKGAPDA